MYTRARTEWQPLSPPADDARIFGRRLLRRVGDKLEVQDLETPRATPTPLSVAPGGLGTFFAPPEFGREDTFFASAGGGFVGRSSYGSTTVVRVGPPFYAEVLGGGLRVASSPGERCALVYGATGKELEWCPPAAPVRLSVPLGNDSVEVYANEDKLLGGGCLPHEFTPFRLLDLREARARRVPKGEPVYLRTPHGSSPEPGRLATQLDFAHWNEGNNSVATSTSCPVQVTWAPHWFAEIGEESEIILRRDPNSPVELELRAISFADAAIAVSPDGHYDLLGSEPDKARPFLACEVEGHPAPFESCEHMRVPGLLAKTWERLERAADAPPGPR